MAGTNVWPIAAVTGSPTYDGRHLRQTTVAPFVAGATATRPLGARSGVRPGTPTTTVTATSTTWTVGEHAGLIDAELAAEAGPYTYSIDVAQTGSMTAADPSNPRIDVVYIRIDDPAESDGSSVPLAAAGYQAGTPAASPVAPTTWTGSARSMVLAQINVPKVGGGSPSVTWVAPVSVAAGGITPATASAFGSGQYVGQYIDDPTNGLMRWSGSAWVAVAGADTGWLTMTLDSGATVSNSYTPKYRRLNGVVYLEGQVTMGGSTIWTVPAGFRRNVGSNAPRYGVMTGASGTTAGVVIYSGATNQIYTTGGATVNLDGISWIAEA